MRGRLRRLLAHFTRKWWFSATLFLSHHGISKLAQTLDADDALIAIFQITRGLTREALRRMAYPWK